MTSTEDNTNVQTYLFFDGRCEEALDFYVKAIGAKVEFLMRFKDSPDQSMCAPGADNKILHATFRVGNHAILASDGRNTGKPKFEGFALSLTVKDEAEANRLFTALEKGGQVEMPLTKTFFSPRFGMVVDRFDVCWMIMVAPPIAPFTITRTFNASRDRVWKAWTDRAELMQWFGPKGFKMTTANLDLRPGGSFHYCLQGTDGKSMWGKFVYREIAAPGRIVLVNSFSDEKGGVSRHPMAPTWPIEMLSTTTLTEESGQTKITIEWVPLNPTDEERRTFDGAHDGMKQGWSGTFEQLDAYLANKK
jgi:uncharacterized glyoxalase superfamily protein PhnB/uncharacterized protein YndB with AHSA1/START domain